MPKIIPITLLTGYLGAGKTTLLNNVLKNNEGCKVAVIVNDIGEVNIDATLIAQNGIVTGTDSGLVALQNGCICCNLKEDLIEQVGTLVESMEFDYILIEASGICEPIPIVQSLAVVEETCKRYNLPAVARVDNVVCVVDALRFVDEFGGGSRLLSATDEKDEPIEKLLVAQIEFCSKIVLNKTDLVSEEEKRNVRAVLAALAPKAEIIEAVKGSVPVSRMMHTGSFNFEEACVSAGWMQALSEGADDHEDHDHDHDHHDHRDHEDHDHHDHHDHKEEEDEECPRCHGRHKEGECSCGHDHAHGHSHSEEYGIGTYVYLARRPLDLKKFNAFCKTLPKKIIRTKGIAWFAMDNEGMYVFEQAGRQFECYLANRWIAAYPEAERKAFIAEHPDIMTDWQEGIGDRMVKLVFIGQDLDRRAIEREMNACLA